MEKTQVPTYLRAGDIAQRLGVSMQTIQYYIRHGRLVPDAVASGKAKLFTEKTVDAFVRSFDIGDDLTIEDVAAEMGIPVSQARALVYRSKVLAPVRRGRRRTLLFSRTDVERLIAERIGAAVADTP